MAAALQLVLVAGSQGTWFLSQLLCGIVMTLAEACAFQDGFADIDNIFPILYTRPCQGNGFSPKLDGAGCPII